MPLTAPYIETQQVVTGFLYQLHIAEENSGAGITRLDIGPYFFGGTAGRVPYPEAVTNEMTPPGWQAIHWHTDEAGASWLRWEGGRLDAEDGELIFQMTSNYPPGRGDAALYVGRGRRGSDRFAVAAPDYSQHPPVVNARHDVKGQVAFARSTGCAPLLLLGVVGVGTLVRHWLT